MRFSTGSRPSPAVIFAAAAIAVAAVGTATAGPDGPAEKVSKSRVKSIAKKQIRKAAPGLSVASADSSYARALISAEPLNVSLARNIEQSQVDNPRTGVFCFDLDFTPAGVQVSNEFEGFEDGEVVVSAVLDPRSRKPRGASERGNSFNGCDPGTDIQVDTVDAYVPVQNAAPVSDHVDSSFFIEVSR